MESKNRGRDLVDMYLSLFMKNSHLTHLLYLLDSLYPGKANIFYLLIAEDTDHTQRS